MNIFPSFHHWFDIDPVIPGLSMCHFLQWWPYLILRLRQGGNIYSTAFCCSQLLYNALHFVRSYYQPDEGGTPTLGSCTCYHFGSRNKALWERGFCLIFMFHFFTIPQNVLETCKRKEIFLFDCRCWREQMTYLSQIEIWTDNICGQNEPCPGSNLSYWKCNFSNRSRTTVTTTRFEQNLIGLVPIIAQHSW